MIRGIDDPVVQKIDEHGFVVDAEGPMFGPTRWYMFKENVADLCVWLFTKRKWDANRNADVIRSPSSFEREWRKFQESKS